MALKVLVWTCSFEQRSAGQYVAYEAVRQGYDVRVVGSRERPDEMLPVLYEYKPDVVFSFCIRPNLVPYFKKIRATGAKLVLWYPDMTETSRDRMWRTLLNDVADMLVFSILETAQRYNHLAPYVVWMPQYFDQYSCLDSATQQLPRRLDPNKPIYNLVFIGSTDATRRNWLQLLQRMYGPVYFAIDTIGRGNEVREFRMAEAYAQSKIAINLQRVVFRNSGLYVTSNRIYNAMGGGAFFISHPVTRLDLVFQPGKHCVVHNDQLDDLCRLIDYYLEHEDEREAIAAEGQKQVLQYHTLEQRVREYWEIMQSLVDNTVPECVAFGEWSNEWHGQPFLASNLKREDRVIVTQCRCHNCDALVSSLITYCFKCGAKL